MQIDDQTLKDIDYMYENTFTYTIQKTFAQYFTLDNTLFILITILICLGVYFLFKQNSLGLPTVNKYLFIIILLPVSFFCIDFSVVTYKRYRYNMNSKHDVMTARIMYPGIRKSEIALDSMGYYKNKIDSLSIEIENADNDSIRDNLRDMKLLLIDSMFEVSKDVMTFDLDDGDEEIDFPTPVVN